jgi:hypothetical protein
VGSVGNVFQSNIRLHMVSTLPYSYRHRCSYFLLLDCFIDRLIKFFHFLLTNDRINDIIIT